MANARTQRKRAARNGKDEGEAAIAPVGPPKPDQKVSELGDGIFIQRSFGDDGDTNVRLIPIGEATVTEAPTLCEVGVRLARARLGLG